MFILVIISLLVILITEAGSDAVYGGYDGISRGYSNSGGYISRIRGKIPNIENSDESEFKPDAEPKPDVSDGNIGHNSYGRSYAKSGGYGSNNLNRFYGGPSSSSYTGYGTYGRTYGRIGMYGRGNIHQYGGIIGYGPKNRNHAGSHGFPFNKRSAGSEPEGNHGLKVGSRERYGEMEGYGRNGRKQGSYGAYGRGYGRYGHSYGGNGGF